MQKVPRFGVLIIAVAVAVACAGPPPAPADPPAHATVPAAANAPNRDWSTPPDFAALRREFGESGDFEQQCDHPVREGSKLFERKAWAELLAFTAPWAARCPVDMDAHILRALALERTGRTKEAAAHHVWVRGLFESVLASGDGKTPATAYQVIAVFEEYSMLAIFGYEVQAQALVEGGIDAMQVKADGESRTIFFNPAASFARLQKRLEGGERRQ